MTKLATIRLLITMLQTIAPLIFGLVLASSPVTAQLVAPSALEDLRAKARERMEREAFLTRAIADHPDASYGDGTQVGPFAKAQLAALYASTNRQAEAVRLADEIEREYPESVDHSGSRLTDTLRRMKLLR